jgi:hypothetical protein
MRIPDLQIVVRGTVAYWFLLLVFRLSGFTKSGSAKPGPDDADGGLPGH